MDRLLAPRRPRPALAGGRVPAWAPAVAAWAVLEFGLAIWGTAISSVQVPLWLVEDLKAGDATFGLARGAAVALLALVGPAVGAASDRSSRKPFLAASLVVCALGTALLGASGLALALLAFVVASVGQGIGLIFVDTLLPTVSPAERIGRVGGIGVAAALGGALAGIAVSLLVTGALDAGRRPVFLVVALLVLLLGLPALRWIAEGTAAPAPPAARRPGGSFLAALAQVRRTPGLARLLVAHLFYSDAASTMTTFMAIYAVAEIGFSETEAQLVILAGIVAGIAGGLVGGRLTDRDGPKRALVAMLLLWLAVFAGAAAIPLLDLPRSWFWLIAPLAGFGLGGGWAADRPFLLRLAPPEALGQVIGLYSSVGRVAGISGPLLWALIVDGLGWGRPAAVLGLGVMTLLGLVVLAPLDDGLRHAVAPDAA